MLEEKNINENMVGYLKCIKNKPLQPLLLKAFKKLEMLENF